MTIREIEARLASACAVSPLFAALHRLRALESLQAFKSDDYKADWIIWSDRPGPALSAPAR